MDITSKKSVLSAQASDALLIGVVEGETELAGEALEIDRKLSGKLSDIIASGEFAGKQNQLTIVHTFESISAKRVILAGLGKRSKLTADSVRNLIGMAAKLVRKVSARTCSVSLENLSQTGLEVEELSRVICEGFILGLYKFKFHKTNVDNKDQEVEVEEVSILCSDENQLAALDQGIKVGTLISMGVITARDLGNHPGNYITPSKLGEIASDMAKENGVSCTIYDKAGVEKLGMGAFLSVAKGSDEPLNLIKLEYKPAKPVNSKPVIFVGKAVTFDSGGISLKGSEDMHKMKDDMSGGAAVIAVTATAARMGLPVHIITIVPACENLPSGKASKPGDIVKTMSGKTVEIQNTDAEGRLILSDALHFATTYAPELIVDVATLTGACVVALGSISTGLLGNNEGLISRIKDAGAKSGERVWELPMWDEYHEAMESDVADLRNVGGRKAGTITAAKFLEDFVGETPWVHLDIAGTSWNDKESGYTAKGASGAGVRLLTQFLIDYNG